jgi:diketogulonate reductase-like aldo/keto reductase
MTLGQQNTEEEGHQQLDMAFDKYGINMLDTAEIYPVPTKSETQGKTGIIMIMIIIIIIMIMIMIMIIIIMKI